MSRRRSKGWLGAFALALASACQTGTTGFPERDDAIDEGSTGGTESSSTGGTDGDSNSGGADPPGSCTCQAFDEGPDPKVCAAAQNANVTLDGRPDALEPFRSSTLPALGELASAITERRPGDFRYRFRVEDFDASETWTREYRLLVDQADGVFRKVIEDILDHDTGEVTVLEETPLEQLDPAEIARIPGECTQVYAQERWRCMHDIVAAAAAVATCD